MKVWVAHAHMDYSHTEFIAVARRLDTIKREVKEWRMDRGLGKILHWEGTNEPGQFGMCIYTAGKPKGEYGNYDSYELEKVILR